MTRGERETVIQWDEELQVVSLYSCVSSVWRKAERAGWALVRTGKDSRGREISREYTAPVRLFRFSCRSSESDAKYREGARSRAIASGARPVGVSPSNRGAR